MVTWFIPLVRCPRAQGNKSHNPSLQTDNPYMISLYIPQNFANRSYLEAFVDILNAISYRDLGLEFAANYFTLLWSSAFSIGLHRSHATQNFGMWPDLESTLDHLTSLRVSLSPMCDLDSNLVCLRTAHYFLTCGSWILETSPFHLITDTLFSLVFGFSYTFDLHMYTYWQTGLLTYDDRQKHIRLFTQPPKRFLTLGVWRTQTPSTTMWESHSATITTCHAIVDRE